MPPFSLRFSLGKIEFRRDGTVLTVCISETGKRDRLIEFIVRGDGHRFLEAIQWMSTRMTSFLTVCRENNGERRKLHDRQDVQLYVSLKCEPGNAMKRR